MARKKDFVKWSTAPVLEIVCEKHKEGVNLACCTLVDKMNAIEFIVEHRECTNHTSAINLVVSITELEERDEPLSGGGL